MDNIPLDYGTDYRQNETNIAVFAKDFNPREFEGAGAASINEIVRQDFEVYNDDLDVKQNSSQISITLPQSLFKNLDIESKNQNQRISFAIYRSTLFFASFVEAVVNMTANTVRENNSYVISGSVKGQKLKDLSEPVVTTYKPLRAAVDDSTACVFWNFTANNGTGDWAPDGCSFQGIKNGIVRCHCTHLTNFAILMVNKFSYL